MIDKKLNQIRDKINIKSVGDDEMFLTKAETKYLLRLLENAEGLIEKLQLNVLKLDDSIEELQDELKLTRENK